MSSIPQERRDTGLIVMILVIVVLVVGGLAIAASQSSTGSVANEIRDDGDAGEREDAARTYGPRANPGTERPEASETSIPDRENDERQEGAKGEVLQ